MSGIPSALYWTIVGIQTHNIYSAISSGEIVDFFSIYGQIFRIKLSQKNPEILLPIPSHFRLKLETPPLTPVESIWSCGKYIERQKTRILTFRHCVQCIGRHDLRLNPTMIPDEKNIWGARLKRIGKNRSDKAFLKKLGLRISHEIESQGFASPYDFWIKKADGKFSRTTLNYILSGKIDAKITTLRAIARLLKIKPHQLIDLRSPPKPGSRGSDPAGPSRTAKTRAAARSKAPDKIDQI